jgi:hypothetical protein
MYKFQLEQFLFDVNAQTALPYLLLHAPVEQLLWEHRGAQQQIWFAAYNLAINCACLISSYSDAKHMTATVMLAMLAAAAPAVHQMHPPYSASTPPSAKSVMLHLPSVSPPST